MRKAPFMCRVFGGRCLYCGWTGSEELTIDHVRPEARGGVRVGNIVPACRSCNHDKGKRGLVAWLKSRPDLSLDAIEARARQAIERARGYQGSSPRQGSQRSAAVELERTGRKVLARLHELRVERGEAVSAKAVRRAASDA